MISMRSRQFAGLSSGRVLRLRTWFERFLQTPSLARTTVWRFSLPLSVPTLAADEVRSVRSGNKVKDD